MHTSKRLLLRSISWVVMTSFVFADLGYAMPVTKPLPKKAMQLNIGDYIQNPDQLEIPYEHVTLREIHKGTNGKLIVHIQDAHANLSGQKSMAAALDHFMNRYNLNLVLVEGSARDSTLDEVRELAPLKNWKVIARRLLFDGIISGEEYLNLTTDHDMKIMGIEYRDLYDDSIRTYAALVDERKDILHYLYKTKNALERLKNAHYPKVLLEYEKNKKDWEDDGFDFKKGFVELLALVREAQMTLTDFPEVAKLEVLTKHEDNIDFDQANQDQIRLFDELNKKGSEEEVKMYAERMKRIQNLQVSQYNLMKTILDQAEQQDIPLQLFAELLEYQKYLKDFAELDLDTLLSELELLEDLAYQKLLSSSDAKQIRAIDRFIGLLGNAYKLQMTSKDFAMYKFNQQDFPTESWLAFMNQKLAESGFFENMMVYKPYLDDAKAKLAEFYTLVDKRDGAFVANAKRIMQERQTNAAVLIAGGYHTAHLTELLKNEGSSYIVLTPVITEITDHEKYENLLLAHLGTINAESEGDQPLFSAENVAATKIPRGLKPPAFDRKILSTEPSRLSFMDDYDVSPAKLNDTLSSLRSKNPETFSPTAEIDIEGGRISSSDIVNENADFLHSEKDSWNWTATGQPGETQATLYFHTQTGKLTRKNVAGSKQIFLTSNPAKFKNQKESLHAFSLKEDNVPKQYVNRILTRSLRRLNAHYILQEHVADQFKVEEAAQRLSKIGYTGNKRTRARELLEIIRKHRDYLPPMEKVTSGDSTVGVPEPNLRLTYLEGITVNRIKELNALHESSPNDEGYWEKKLIRLTDKVGHRVTIRVTVNTDIDETEPAVSKKLFHRARYIVQRGESGFLMHKTPLLSDDYQDMAPGTLEKSKAPYDALTEDDDADHVYHAWFENPEGLNDDYVTLVVDAVGILPNIKIEIMEDIVVDPARLVEEATPPSRFTTKLGFSPRTEVLSSELSVFEKQASRISAVSGIAFNTEAFAVDSTQTLNIGLDDSRYASINVTPLPDRLFGAAFVGDDQSVSVTQEQLTTHRQRYGSQSRESAIVVPDTNNVTDARKTGDTISIRKAWQEMADKLKRFAAFITRSRHIAQEGNVPVIFLHLTDDIKRNPRGSLETAQTVSAAIEQGGRLNSSIHFAHLGENDPLASRWSEDLTAFADFKPKSAVEFLRDYRAEIEAGAQLVLIASVNSAQTLVDEAGTTLDALAAQNRITFVPTKPATRQKHHRPTVYGIGQHLANLAQLSADIAELEQAISKDMPMYRDVFQRKLDIDVQIKALSNMARFNREHFDDGEAAYGALVLPLIEGLTAELGHYKRMLRSIISSA